MLIRFLAGICVWLALSAEVMAKITLQDAEGRLVTLAAPAQRAYIGFYYEDFLAINGPDSYQQVVAFSKSDWTLRHSQWPLYQAAIPRLAQLVDVGSLYNHSFDFERLLATRPDLLILAKWQLEGFANYLPVLQRLSIPYIVIDFNQGEAAKLTSIRAMGLALGHGERAERLAQVYQQGFADITRRIAQANLPPVKAYLELADKGAGEYSSSYGESIWGPLLQHAGADNIAKGMVTSPSPLRPEYVLSSAPEAIFLAGGDWPKMPDAVAMGFGINLRTTQQRISQYIKRPGWAQLPAVKQQRVYALYHPGARTLHDYIYAQFIAKALYPSAFKDIDPQRNLEQFYEAYLPIKAEGVFLQQWQGQQ